MSDAQINLLQRNINPLGQLANLEVGLRRVAWWSLIVVFVVSVVVGALYLFARSQVAQLDATKIRITRDINAQGVKEGLVLSLKERVTIAGRALDAAKPWGKLFIVLEQVAPEAAFRTVSVEDTGRVTSSIELGSVDEAVTVIGNVVTLASQHLLRSPQMLSFAFREAGDVQITMSFHPVF